MEAVPDSIILLKVLERWAGMYTRTWDWNELMASLEQSQTACSVCGR